MSLSYTQLRIENRELIDELNEVNHDNSVLVDKVVELNTKVNQLNCKRRTDKMIINTQQIKIDRGWIH